MNFPSPAYFILFADSNTANQLNILFIRRDADMHSVY